MSSGTSHESAHGKSSPRVLWQVDAAELLSVDQLGFDLRVTQASSTQSLS